MSAEDGVFSGRTGLAYISPIQTPRGKGFAVAVPKPGGGYVRRNFFTAPNQGLSDTLDSAIAWRDSKHVALHGVAVPVRVFHSSQVNSSTGIVGVRRADKIVKKRLASGETRLYEVPVVIAEVWLEPGRDGRRPRSSRSKVFSVRKHGLETALNLAKQWRLEQTAALAHGPLQTRGPNSCIE